MNIYIILFLLSFLATYLVIPYSLEKFKNKKMVVLDMYKSEKNEIPTNLGIIVLFSSFIIIAISPLISRAIDFLDFFYVGNPDLNEYHLALLLVVAIYSMYGLVDDLIDINRKLKLLLPVLFGYPLMIYVNPSVFEIPFYGEIILTDEISFGITLGDIFKITVIPIYVMVVSNLVNMHSGYNGLQSGLSFIILITLSLKSSIDGELSKILPVSVFSGSILAFWFYNKYPSKVFEGNIGALMFGSVIGSTIVIQEYWWFGFFILLPHTFNFLLWVIWLFLMKTNPEIYLEENGKHKKFGKVRADNTIEVPNRLTLKWIPNYYFRINEKHTVLVIYLISIIFCFVGVLIF